MPQQDLVPAVILSKTGTSGLTTDTGPSFGEKNRRLNGLAAVLTITALAGTAPSITGKVQHTADPDTVPDASANWIDLLTFTALTAVGAQFQVIATPYFPRLRATVTRAGTAVTNMDYSVTIV